MKAYVWTAWVGAVALLCARESCGEGKAGPDPVLTKFRCRIEKEFAELSPRPTFEMRADEGGGALLVRYGTREYIVHPRTKDGRVSKETVRREGPGDKGFLLRIRIQPLATVNQAHVPQTVRGPYWDAFHQAYEMPKNGKQIYFVLEYGPRTDPAWIRKLKKIAEEFGRPRCATPRGRRSAHSEAAAP